MIHHGDCLQVLRTLPDNSVDAVVTDPPYGLSFMGKKWDYDVPSVEVWAECLRVLKPGGHLLAFAGTRTQHRMAVRIEDAGFEIRDMIAWVYGSGFPKSLDVSKAIDKAAGAVRERVPGTGGMHRGVLNSAPDATGSHTWTAEQTSNEPATEAAAQWQGWGTALKPALEPITVARKPLIGTVAENVLAHGTGGINVDGCRVECKDKAKFPAGTISDTEAVFGGGAGRYASRARTDDGSPNGRWPANLIHDGSDEVVGLFHETGASKASMRGEKTSAGTHTGWARESHKGFNSVRGHNDSGGSAARFFYCAKASKRDRDEGLEGFEARPAANAYGDGLNTATKVRTEDQAANGVSRDERRNHHPTVKPTELMRYLCRLVTPPGGVVLDPFTGSGSTGKAAILEGFRFIGIEREAEYVEIARARIAAAEAMPKQGDLF